MRIAALSRLPEHDGYAVSRPHQAAVLSPILLLDGELPMLSLPNKLLDKRPVMFAVFFQQQRSEEAELLPFLVCVSKHLWYAGLVATNWPLRSVSATPIDRVLEYSPPAFFASA